MADDAYPSRRQFLAATAGFLTGGTVGAALGKLKATGEQRLADPVPAKPILSDEEKEDAHARWALTPIQYGPDGHSPRMPSGKPDAEEDDRSIGKAEVRDREERRDLAVGAASGALTGTMVTVAGSLIRSAGAADRSDDR